MLLTQMDGLVQGLKRPLIVDVGQPNLEQEDL